jgi:hypothetical protein
MQEGLSNLLVDERCGLDQDRKPRRNAHVLHSTMVALIWLTPWSSVAMASEDPKKVLDSTPHLGSPSTTGGQLPQITVQAERRRLKARLHRCLGESDEDRH